MTRQGWDCGGSAAPSSGAHCCATELDLAKLKAREAERNLILDLHLEKISASCMSVCPAAHSSVIICEKPL